MDAPTVGPNTARVGDEHLLMPVLVIEMAHLGKLRLVLSAEEEQVLVDIVEFGVRVEVACLLQLFIRDHYINIRIVAH